MSHKGKVSIMWILFREVYRKKMGRKSRWIAIQSAVIAYETQNGEM